ncbi:hypothetical protein MADA3029_960009 [Vibrio nigripulchritudo MADA3029]|uniref:MazG nucleotide pyrophosphohydrolase domain-containing protein n=1 Tax=Vibrio nigripulchritudo TaxID=28173 RepID=UPI0003B212C1|nr:MazG nucleotide pyrophosphohydrolase domain-containing protein [Vibrio nigripulchritudo]CCN50663.1 hypothetical protein VIBNIMADA3020_950009 [Vibrio nigripulchritudo MADA3020]CCN51868.1 hypothetical protein VIBNIMADA3021_1180009 [Vibrio nigripulchritudo MADA3021]CCN62370.1 hypothetical protein MADA3029_960009 [Vibrio nigripulchritudo MADA3029]
MKRLLANNQLLLSELETIAQVKSQRDLEGTWFKICDTYLQAMIEEVEEVRTEITSGKQCFLEDELGDLLCIFVFLCFLSTSWIIKIKLIRIESTNELLKNIKSE